MVSTGVLLTTGLGVGDIDVIIDMAVIGGEMAMGEPQRDVAVAYRQIGDVDHSKLLHVCQNKKKTSFGPGKQRFCRKLKKRFLLLYPWKR